MHCSTVNMSQQEKINLVCSLRKEGLKIDEIAERTRIPRSSVGKYLKYYLESTEEERSNSRSQAQEISNEIPDEISPRTRSQENIHVGSQLLDPIGENVFRLNCGLREVTNEKPFQTENQSEDPDVQENSKPPLWENQNPKQPGITWNGLAKNILWSIPLLVLLPWLIFTSANVYKKDVGNFWGWSIAIGIETFTMAVAAFIPKMSFDTSSPINLVKTIPRFFKTVFHYALLIALCYYSYTTTTLTVTENTLNSLSEIKASSLKTTNISDLRNEKAQMLQLIHTYEKQGWLGEIRNIRDDIKTIDAKLESEKNNLGVIDQGSIAAVKHRSIVSKYLRIIVLFIIAYCLHIITNLHKKTNYHLKRRVIGRRI